MRQTRDRVVRDEFEVQHEGKPYKCVRVITDHGSYRTQRIEVPGCGGKEDYAQYGAPPQYHPEDAAVSVARLIAHELIREHGGKLP